MTRPVACVAFGGPGGAFGDEVAAALVARGFAVDDHIGADVAYDGVVHVVGADPPPVVSALAGLGPDEWTAAADDVIAATMRVLQLAYAALRDRGGRIVLVVPTIGFAGAAGLVAYTTAVEGIRAMAKSAARQWAGAGITVNAVGVPLTAIASGTAPVAHVPAAALGSVDVVAGAAGAITYFLGDDAAGTSGATVVVDGGSVMTP